MKRLLNILKAWIRHPLGPWKMVLAYWRRCMGKETIDDLAMQRLNVCAECSHIDRHGEKCLFPENVPCCGICGCALSLKIYGGKEDCPLGKWSR